MKVSILGTIVTIIMLINIVFWVINAYKLSKCDFESPYKCEVMHGIGIIPPFSIFTVWFDTDEK